MPAVLTRPEPEARATSSLFWALMANLLVHALAMAAMATLLLPMMPGGTDASDIERIATLARHPWRFRVGWWPWHACAVADVWMAVVIARSPLLPRRTSVLALALTLVAVVPDQLGQIRWVTAGLELAREAHATGELTPYLASELEVLRWTAVYGALGYTLATALWALAFHAAGWLTATGRAVSVAVVVVMLAMTVGPMLPPPLTLPPPAIAAGNAAGFVLLLGWLGLLATAARARLSTARQRDSAGA